MGESGKSILCDEGGGSFSTAIFNSDIQLCFFPLLVFYICLSIWRFVKKVPKICALFCLVDIKKLSFLTSCVFCSVWWWRKKKRAGNTKLFNSSSFSTTPKFDWKIATTSTPTKERKTPTSTDDSIQDTQGCVKVTAVLHHSGPTQNHLWCNGRVRADEHYFINDAQQCCWLTKPENDMKPNVYIIYWFIYWRFIAQSIAQSHLRAFH